MGQASSKVTFKTVLLGDGAVGKTSMRKRYLGEDFTGNYQMTIGADFVLKRVTLDDTLYVMQIWDLAGQATFNKFRSMYYRGAMGGLLVFDIARPQTFDNLSKWINEIHDNRGELIPLVLIGNKSDLRESAEKPVAREEAEAYAEELSNRIGYYVPYIETSALHDINIEEAFVALVRNVAKIVEQELSGSKSEDTESKSAPEIEKDKPKVKPDSESRDEGHVDDEEDHTTPASIPHKHTVESVSEGQSEQISVAQKTDTSVQEQGKSGYKSEEQQVSTIEFDEIKRDKKERAPVPTLNHTEENLKPKTDYKIPKVEVDEQTNEQSKLEQENISEENLSQVDDLPSNYMPIQEVRTRKSSKRIRKKKTKKYAWKNH